MTFFYDLFKRLDAVENRVESTQLTERANKWIQGAVDPEHKGDLHKALHVAQDKKIPKSKIEKATHSRDPHLRHMAQFAKNVAHEDMNEADMEEGNRFTRGLSDDDVKVGEKIPGTNAVKTKDIDENWNDMLNDVKRRADMAKKGDTEHGTKHDIKHTSTGRMVTRRVDPEGMSVGADGDSDTQAGPRGRGRPKGTGKSTGAKGPSGNSKLMNPEEIEEAIAALEECGYTVTPLEEKAVSKKQQKFKKKDAEDFAATKHEGLPEKKKSEGKKKSKDVEESGTTAGSVATSSEAANSKPEGKKKSGGSSVVGKGIYDSLNRELESMISESMNINVSMSTDPHGGPQKSVTVTATDDDAAELAMMLSRAGVNMGADTGAHACAACGQAPCGCAKVVDENAADWPTQPEYQDMKLSTDPISNDLNRNKSTGQTVDAPPNLQEPRQGVMKEDQDDECPVHGYYALPNQEDESGCTCDSGDQVNEVGLGRLSELAGLGKGQMAEAIPTPGADIDSGVTMQYAKKIKQALENTTSATIKTVTNQDGSVTVIVNPSAQNPSIGYMVPNGPYGATMQNVDTAIDPFYRMFRQKGWRFDQPMQGKFTIAVPVSQGVEEGIVDWAKEKYHDYQTGRQWNKFGKAQRNGDQAGMQAAQDAAAAHKDQLQAARYRRTGSTLSKDTSTGLGQDVANLKALKAKGLAEDLQADDGKHYDSFADFIGQFYPDSFDKTKTYSAGREIRGYINGRCVMSWEFDDESMTSGYGNYDMTMLEDDRLMARTGINSVNKFARPGQTDYSEIPAGNHPRSKHKYSDEYRSSQPERLKHSIKASLGKHAEPNLPESMASMLGRLDELAEADIEEGADQAVKKAPAEWLRDPALKQAKSLQATGLGLDDPAKGFKSFDNFRGPDMSQASDPAHFEEFLNAFARVPGAMVTAFMSPASTQPAMAEGAGQTEKKSAAEWLRDPRLETQVTSLQATGLGLDDPAKGFKSFDNFRGPDMSQASNPMYFRDFLNAFSRVPGAMVTASMSAVAPQPAMAESVESHAGRLFRELQQFKG